MNKHIQEYYQSQMIKDAFNKLQSFPTKWRYENKVKLQDVCDSTFPTRTKRTMEDSMDTHLHTR